MSQCVSYSLMCQVLLFLIVGQMLVLTTLYYVPWSQGLGTFIPTMSMYRPPHRRNTTVNIWNQHSINWTVSYDIGTPQSKTVKQYLRQHCTEVQTYAQEMGTMSTTADMCPCVGPDLEGRLDTAYDYNVTIPEIVTANPEVRVGGSWWPSWCRSYQHLAVVIPYRDREQHLHHLLNHLHPILQKQLLNYTVFVVEQTHNATFNRAILLNIGYVRSQVASHYDCYIFHDVDLLPEDDRMYYTCSHEYPVQFGGHTSKHKYKLPYSVHFGAVASLTSRMFEEQNGYSNLFFGWGQEDDDMATRLVRKYHYIKRPPTEVGTYTAIEHTRDEGNNRNNDEKKIIEKKKSRNPEDGLSTLAGKYTIVQEKELPLYTWILVDVDEEKIMTDNQVTLTGDVEKS